MATLLSRLIRPRRKPLAALAIAVYTREKCCCCEKAIDLLKEAQREHGFAIEEIDIDKDEALVAAHGLSVPVVVVRGKIRFKGVVNPVLLERLLEDERREITG
jgi:glutaredoxin